MVSFNFTTVFLVFSVVFLAFDKGEAVLSDSQECDATPAATDICDEKQGLECVPSAENNKKGICRCTGNSEFDPIKKKCMAVLGGACSTDKKIVSCLDQLICGKAKKCIKAYNQKCSTIKDCNSEDSSMMCKDSKCQCNKEFLEDKDSYCRKAFDSPCTPTKGCNSEKLFCNEGRKCTCSLDYARTEDGNCSFRIGTNCTKAADTRCGLRLNSIGTECSKNELLKDMCLCKKGYTPNLALTDCYKGIDETCVEPTAGKEDECNKDQGLSCINKKCGCTLKDDQIYDQKKYTCVSKVTKRCTLNPGAQTDEFLQCEEGAKCERFFVENRYVGVCNEEKSASGGISNSLSYFLLITMISCLWFKF